MSLTKATFSMIEGMIANVEDYGATGDGVTDDAAAIQAAIDAVDANGGGSVYFVGGKNYLASNIILLRTNVRLIGNGCTISVNPLNYTGGITRFYGVFSTVNITSRPLTILWRIGSGTISFENIVIDGFTFNVNRDGGTLTSGQMLVSEINIVRFEDARNCIVSNCNFIDQMTSANYNQSQIVMYVRSENCQFVNCYGTNVGLFWSAECNLTTIENVYVPVSAGTAIETVAGQTYRILNNRTGETWAAVSSIGVNSRQCMVTSNTVDKAALTGITVGHPTSSGGANQYNLPLDASYSVCNDNYILSGDTASASHGYIGVLVQSANYATIADNTILSLRKKTAYTDRAAGVLVQPDTAANATGVRVERNRISTANNGVHFVRGELIVMNGNAINDVYGGLIYESTTNTPSISAGYNSVDTAERAVSFANGNAVIYNNTFANISSASFSVACTRGNVRFENNILSECGELYLGIVKSAVVTGNLFENAVVKTRAGSVDNASAAGTATINLITVLGNNHPGTTDMLRLTGVLGQSTRVVENTAPTQFRTTSYNVGTLPTSSAGLSSGDIYNDTGTVKVV